MVISIDIQEMQQIASLLNEAKEKIDESANVVSRISEHNDWNCRERVAINQRIAKNKKEQKKLQEKMAIFSSKVTTASSQFSEIDAKTLTAFRNLDALFSKLLSVATPTVGGSAGTAQFAETTNQVAQADVTDPLSSYSLGSVTEPIRVCEFNAIQMSGKGGN